MATGRTLDKHKRIYIGGYDLSGNARSCGPIGVEYDEADLTAWTDTAHGFLRSHSQTNIGTFNAVFDNTATTGIHIVLPAAGGERNVIVAQGIRAVPAAGDPAFGGTFIQSAYAPQDDGGGVVVSVPFAGWSASASSLIYSIGWGTLLHASGAETGANSANSGIDNPTAGATTSGGYLCYQVLAGDGTATLSVDDSANNSTWLALSGATSGSINCTAVTSGLVALTATATVRRYLRWQVALGTATTVTFVLMFARNYP